MERDFRYLRDKNGDAGAREIFEKICVNLFQKMFENAYSVKASPGDDGIDILVGDLDKPIVVYQCKYFIDGIGEVQKGQIRDSFNTVTGKYSIKEWYLCVPIVFTVENHKWWSEWKTEKQQTYCTQIELYDGSRLIGLLKQKDMYNTTFDDDIRLALESIEQYLISENNRIYNEIIFDINEFSDVSYDDCIFVKMLEIANIVDTSNFKNDFFNAEIAKQKIISKGQKQELTVYEQLKMKLRSIWKTQYDLFKNPTDGNELIGKTYIRVEDLDTTTLAATDEINLLAKKGMLHQLAEDKKIGWIENYANKLELYFKEHENDGDN